MFRTGISFLFSISLISPAFAVFELDPPTLDIAIIKKYTGLTGQFDAAKNTFKVSSPRDDLKVIVNGVKLTPAMGLSSWAVFKKSDHSTLLKGELVLTENQIDPVLTAVINNHLRVNSLHNHFLWDSPKVMFMHIEGAGNEKELAVAVSKVFATIKMTDNGEGIRFPLAAIDTANTNLHPQRVDNILGAKGILENGVYRINVNRPSMLDNHKVGNSVDASTQANFAGHDDGAVVDGDFAMYEENLQAVLSTLHHAGISIVAIHQRLTTDGQSRIVFLHYWGVGNIGELALGVRAALDAAQVHATQLREARIKAAQQVASQVNAAQLSIEQLNTAHELSETQRKITVVNRMLLNTAQQKSTLANMAKIDAIEHNAIRLATALNAMLQNTLTKTLATLQPTILPNMLQNSLSYDEVALNTPLLNMESLTRLAQDTDALDAIPFTVASSAPASHEDDALGASLTTVAPLNLALLSAPMLNEASQNLARLEQEAENRNQMIASLEVTLSNMAKEVDAGLHNVSVSTMVQNATSLDERVVNAPLLQKVAMNFDVAPPSLPETVDPLNAMSFSVPPLNLASLSPPMINEVAQQKAKWDAEEQSALQLVASLKTLLPTVAKLDAAQLDTTLFIAMLENATTLNEVALNAPLVNSALLNAESLSLNLPEISKPSNDLPIDLNALHVPRLNADLLREGLLNQRSPKTEETIQTVQTVTDKLDLTFLNAVLLRATPIDMTQFSLTQSNIAATLLNVALLNKAPINNAPFDSIQPSVLAMLLNIDSTQKTGNSSSEKI